MQKMHASFDSRRPWLVAEACGEAGFLALLAVIALTSRLQIIQVEASRGIRPESSPVARTAHLCRQEGLQGDLRHRMGRLVVHHCGEGVRSALLFDAG